MARRGDSGSVTFDLVPDGDPEGPEGWAMPAGAPGTDDVPEAGGTPGPTAVAPSVVTRAARVTSRWLRSRPPLQLVAGAVVVALGISGWGIASVMQDRAEEARLRVAAGGVLDLSQPLREHWSYQADPDGLSFPVGLLDGGVVVIGERMADMMGIGIPASGTPTVLHGLDVESGAERWTVPFDDAAACGESFMGLGFARAAMTSRPSLVCVVGQGEGVEVAVVAPDGTVSTRDPGGVDDLTTLAPGPEGTLLRLQPTGPAPEGVEVLVGSDGGLELTTGFEPPDVVVSTEDPLTGEELASVTLDAETRVATEALGTCVRWDADGTPHFEVRGSGWLVTPDGVYLQLCGVSAVLTTAGEVVREGAPHVTDATSLADGGMAVRDSGGLGLESAGPAEIIDRDGEVALEVDGMVLDPPATDGTGGIDLTVPAEQRDDDGVLVTARDGRVSAVEADGTQRWSVPAPGFPASVVRADGVVVVLRNEGMDAGTIDAIELDDGRTRWSTEVQGVAGSGSGYFGYARGVWTDGDVVVIATTGNDAYELQAEWAAIDLGTGREVWRLDVEETAKLMTMNDLCFSADGALLCTDQVTVRRLA